MDLGFIRAPDNLPDMVACGASKGKHVIKGQRGETCFLLIIDAATQQMWTFPLKNKHPPTILIDSFLKENGAGRNRAKIMTSPEGMLARSNRFQQTCVTNGFEALRASLRQCAFGDQGQQRRRIHHPRTLSDG
jgi:hypothetical protein